jgi:hypothetical protein
MRLRVHLVTIVLGAVVLALLAAAAAGHATAATAWR